jgi:hypothetical protein
MKATVARRIVPTLGQSQARTAAVASVVIDCLPEMALLGRHVPILRICDGVSVVWHGARIAMWRSSRT